MFVFSLHLPLLLLQRDYGLMLCILGNIKYVLAFLCDCLTFQNPSITFIAFIVTMTYLIDFPMIIESDKYHFYFIFEWNFNDGWFSKKLRQKEIFKVSFFGEKGY